MILEAEIVVIGGGPAGAVIALRLLQLGHDVLLITRSSLPRSFTRETFTPAVADLLAFLDLEDALNGVLTHTITETEIRWHTDRYELYTPAKAGLLANRSAFDSHLLATVAHCGVNVQTVDVRSVRRIENRWCLAGEGRIGPVTLIPRVVVDATGRRGLLPKRRCRDAPLLALSGRWRGSGLPAHVRVTTGDHFWAWGAPAEDHTYDATLFLDPHELKEGRGSLDQRYHTRVRASGLLDRARRADLAGSVQARDATPYVDVNAASVDFLKVGDACATVDPLSSAGVQIAMQSGLSGAIAVHTLRHDPAANELIRTFWSSEIVRRASRHTAWSAEFYREGAKHFDTPFWRSRAGFAGNDTLVANRTNHEPLPKPDQMLQLSELLNFSDAPCIVGNIVERRRIITHPSLSEPLAFLDGVDLPALLARISPGMKATAVLNLWSNEVDLSRSIEILSWIWRHGIIQPLYVIR